MQKRIPNNAGVDLKFDTAPVFIATKKEVKDGQREKLDARPLKNGPKTPG